MHQNIELTVLILVNIHFEKDNVVKLVRQLFELQGDSEKCQFTNKASKTYQWSNHLAGAAPTENGNVVRPMIPLHRHLSYQVAEKSMTTNLFSAPALIKTASTSAKVEGSATAPPRGMAGMIWVTPNRGFVVQEGLALANAVESNNMKEANLSMVSRKWILQVCKR